MEPRENIEAQLSLQSSTVSLSNIMSEAYSENLIKNLQQILTNHQGRFPKTKIAEKTALIIGRLSNLLSIANENYVIEHAELNNILKRLNESKDPTVLRTAVSIRKKYFTLKAIAKALILFSSIAKQLEEINSAKVFNQIIIDINSEIEKAKRESTQLLMDSITIISSFCESNIITWHERPIIESALQSISFFSVQFHDSLTWLDRATESSDALLSSGSYFPTNISASPLVDGIIAPFSQEEWKFLGNTVGRKKTIANDNECFNPTNQLDHLAEVYHVILHAIVFPELPNPTKL